MKNDMNMMNLMNTPVSTLVNTPEHRTETLYTCGRCGDRLPLDAFYVRKGRYARDPYCKECRKRHSRDNRQAGKEREARQAEEASRRPTITEEPDPVRRLALIREARAKVKESVLRKKEREKEMLLLEELA